MKQILSLLFTLLFCVATAWSEPAHPQAVKVKQPDGSTITLRLHGDEWLHFQTTDDGYTVVKDAAGYYVYARKTAEGQLEPTAQRAHDDAMRDGAERAFLASCEKFLHPDFAENRLQARSEEFSRRRAALARRKEPLYDYANFRGLVILVEFNDRKFQREDYDSIANAMLNEENFSGFEHEGQRLEMTGSMRDYFEYSSLGQFVPQFDVVGPVQIDYSMYDANGMDGAIPLIRAALAAADSLVNYKDYDGDDDGTLDMVYFLFAGYSSSYSGNDERLLWPHKWTVFNENPTPGNYWVYFDDVRMGTYACSTEISGWTSGYNYMSGIGTMCHEFSHVLGLPDLYDTDYGENGQSTDPGNWTIMSQGSHLNNGYTPCAYTLYERYAVGFAQPVTLKETGSYTLRDLDVSNTGYRLNTPVNKQYFLLENRQKTKWNRYLPGHGMLIYRVDSTNTRAWYGNTVNAIASHNYFVLLRAAGSMNSSGVPFPGSSNVRTIDNLSTPNLLTWGGDENDFYIDSIAETNGVITFELKVVPAYETIDGFEDAELTTEDTTVKGRYCYWQLMDGTQVVSPGSDNCNGVQAVAMRKNSALRSSLIAEPLKTIMFKVFNSTSQLARFDLYYKHDGETRWTKVTGKNSSATSGVAAESSGTAVYNIAWTAPAQYHIKMLSGSTTAPCYVDDMTFLFTEDVPTAIQGVAVSRDDSHRAPQYFDLSGRRADGGRLGRGVYVVKEGDRVRKVSVR